VVPFVDLSDQYYEIAREVEPELLNVLRRCQFVGGSYLDRFEHHLANYLNVNHVVGVSNGTDAITLACEALGIGKGDTVIVPNNSFIASAFGVSRSGAKPLLLDVHPYTYLLDIEQVEEVLKSRKRVRAILVVDLYGQMPNMEDFRNLAEKYQVYLLEDAAQSIGATYNNHHVGFYSDIATTSFYPTKNLGGICQGGAVITNNPSIAHRVRLMINQGSIKKYEHICMGGNYRLDTIAAVYLYHALQMLDNWNERRRNIAKIYNESFDDNHRPTQNPNSKHIYHLYEYCCDSLEERDRVEKTLLRNDIGYGFHYPTQISDTPMYVDMSLNKKTPVCEDLRDRLISIPMFPTMTEEQAEEVVRVIKSTH